MPTRALAADQISEILRLTETFGHIGFWRVDLKTSSVFWSDEVFAIHGRDPDLGPPDLADAILAYHPDDVPMVQGAIDAATRGGNGFEFSDARILRPDGSIRRVYSRGECRLGPEGRASEIVGIFQDTTEDFERRQSAVEAREHLELLTASGLSIWQYNVADNTVLVSNGLQRMLGFPETEPVAVPLDTFINGMPVEDQAIVWQALFNHVRADLPYLTEHRAYRADGSVIWLRSRGIAERDDSGRAIRVVGTVEDITQRKDQEQALNEAHSRFDLAVRGASVGIWEIEFPGGRMFVSDRLKEIVGAPVLPSEEEGRFVWKIDTFLSNIHPDDRKAVAEALNAHLSSGAALEKQYRFRHTVSGEWIDVLVRGQAEWDKDGHPVRMAGSLEDVSERTRNLKALADSEKRFELAAAGASVGIWEWEIATGSEYWSPHFYELLGLEEESVKASVEAFEALLHPDDVAPCFASVQAHFDTGLPFATEYRLRHGRDGYRWFYGTGKAEFDEAGMPVRMVGSIQDIHDRKLAEDALRRANEDLERYASVVSHDLQEPLRKISQFSSLLKAEFDGKLDGDARLYLDFLTNGAVRMTGLIRDLLEYSRLGESALKIETLDVASEVHQVMQSLSTVIAEADARIEVVPGAMIEADAVLLRQLLQNLISNSLKFRSERGPEITIRTEQNESGIDLTVRDNGIGFGPEFSEKIFEMFGRLHGSDEIAGSGVGLALCKRIAELHGGLITCDSAPGEWSEFTIRFPRRLSQLAA